MQNNAGGINLDTVGVILTVVGAIASFASHTIFSSWSTRGRGDTVIEERRY